MSTSSYFISLVGNIYIFKKKVYEYVSSDD